MPYIYETHLENSVLQWGESVDIHNRPGKFQAVLYGEWDPTLYFSTVSANRGYSCIVARSWRSVVMMMVELLTYTCLCHTRDSSGPSQSYRDFEPLELIFMQFSYSERWNENLSKTKEGEWANKKRFHGSGHSVAISKRICADGKYLALLLELQHKPPFGNKGATWSGLVVQPRENTPFGQRLEVAKATQPNSDGMCTPNTVLKYE